MRRYQSRSYSAIVSLEQCYNTARFSMLAFTLASLILSLPEILFVVCLCGLLLAADQRRDDVAGWYGVYPGSVRRRTEANKHRDGAHHQSWYPVPGRADHGTRLQYRQRRHVTSTQVALSLRNRTFLRISRPTLTAHLSPSCQDCYISNSTHKNHSSQACSYH